MMAEKSFKYGKCGLFELLLFLFSLSFACHCTSLMCSFMSFDVC